MTAILIGLLKFPGACFFIFFCIMLYACVHVGKRGDRQREWWRDDER